MKKILIFLTIVIICAMAFVDAKDRLAELDEIANNAQPSAQHQAKQK